VLSHLHIRNLAVVDEVEFDLSAGLTAVTGETGAGKSILVDALTLALGSRADSRAFRPDEGRCEVTAHFDLDARPRILDWLRGHELDDDKDCILRRVVTAEGRSRGYINGRGVTAQSLRELGEQLVDISGQHAHQSLLSRSVQRAILDSLGKHEGLLQAMQESFGAWQRAKLELEALATASADREQQDELLRYQLQELSALNPAHGEFERLEAEQRLLGNSVRIADGVNLAMQLLYEADESSARDAIQAALGELGGLCEVDRTLADPAQLLAEANILITEAAEALRRRLGSIEHDPARLEQVDRRMASIQELARKHRVPPDELPAARERIARQIEDMECHDERLVELAARQESCRLEMLRAASALSKARKSAAATISRQVTENMQQLGMRGGSLHVSIAALDESRMGPQGADLVDFRVSTNPGQQPGLLRSVASGGELSRISLAIQVAALGHGDVPTLIFDEVDAGVGGRVAEIVGQQLSRLSRLRQIVCITHLPQVASQADQHLRVSKTSDASTARTAVRQLSAAERLEEIARMLGGIEITSRTRAHAEEMLNIGATRRAG
jgi:DNA repair protein RecN (Recombination protein N)